MSATAICVELALILNVNDNLATPMDEFNTTTKNLTPRVLRIWLPSRKARWFALVLLTVGVLISYAIACVILGGILSAITELIDKVPSGLLIPTFMIMAGFGPYIWIRFYNQWQHRLRLRPTKHRSTRLINLFSTYRSIEKLPHRYIEYLLRQRSSNIKPLKRALLTMRHRVVIVTNGPKLDELPRLTPNDISFEPIDLVDGEELADWLVTANYESKNLAKEKYLEVEEKPTDASFKYLYKQVLSWIFQYGGLLYLLIFVGSRIHNGDPVIKWIVITGIIICFAVFFGQTLTERRWWLVPGGLFYREHRFWKKQLKVKLLRATDTPLFLNLELNQAKVVDDGKVRSFTISPSMGLAILAGWISNARTPSDEEIQSFVGISDDLYAHGTRP